MSVGGGKGSSDTRQSSFGEAFSNSLGLGENVSMGQTGSTSQGTAFNQSQNQADSWNQADSFNQANSLNQSNAQSTNDSFSQSGSYVDPNQAGYLDQLRQQAFNTFNASGPTDQYNQLLLAEGRSALGNLNSLGDASQVTEAQLTGLTSGLNDIYNQGLSRIGADASNVGAFGGSRHGLQEAALGGEIAKAYTQGYGDIMANANNQAITANNSAIAGLSPLYNLGMGSQYGSLQALSGLLGDPTVLQNAISQSTGQSTSDAFGTSSSLGGSTATGGSTSTGSSIGGSQNTADSFGQNYGYGYDYNTSDSYAYDQSNSRGSEDNARFGFGIK